MDWATVRKRTPGNPPDVQPLIRVRMKQLHDDCESYAKVTIFINPYNSITSGSAKMTKVPRDRWAAFYSSTSALFSLEKTSSLRNEILPRLFIASFFWLSIT